MTSNTITGTYPTGLRGQGCGDIGGFASDATSDFSEGSAAETFVDSDSPGIFHNAAEFFQPYPRDAAPR